MRKQTLQELRESRGLTQYDLGVHQVMVSRYERGHDRPSSRTLAKIAAALTAAQPDCPVSVPQLVAACRESQRRALVVRARSGQVVEGHRRASCAHRSGAAVRKAGRP